MSDDELERLRGRVKDARKLITRAEQVLAEIDRGPGLSDEQADVLAALRIFIEGKERKSLDDLLSVAGDMSGGKKDLKDVLAPPDDEPTSDWPVIEEKKKDWPGL